MHGYIANTDYDWYTFLKARGPQEEVNFWQPSGNRRFHAVPTGAPFFFKLTKPHYAIAGFGYLARTSILPAWLAWDSFQQANGAPDFPTMIQRIEKYRRHKIADPHGKQDIGCLMVSEPVFFERDQWVPEPKGWPKQAVQGKTYDLRDGEGRRVYEECLARARALASPGILRDEHATYIPALERYGQPVLARPRLGQGSFRIAVTDAYQRACSVTGEHSLPALEAAHIIPFSEGGEHTVSNGLLLRSDIHRLFDKGYVTVVPDGSFEVSRRLKDDFENGHSYYPFHGRPIHLPGTEAERPDPSSLSWHNERVFLG